MRALCLLAAGLLTACSPMNSFVNLQTAQAIQDAQAANDNLIVGVSAAVCAVPVGAVIRNPSFVPVVAAACMPGGQAANSATLIQNMQTNTGIPVYKQTMDAIKAAAAPVSANLPTPAQVKTVPRTVARTSRVGVPVHVPIHNPAPAAPVVSVQPVVPIAQPITAPVPSALPGGALP